MLHVADCLSLLYSAADLKWAHFKFRGGVNAWPSLPNFALGLTSSFDSSNLQTGLWHEWALSCIVFLQEIDARLSVKQKLVNRSCLPLHVLHGRHVWRPDCAAASTKQTATCAEWLCSWQQPKTTKPQASLQCIWLQFEVL